MIKKVKDVLKEIAREYTIEETKDKGCIYILVFPNGKCYIGQSWLLKNRWNGYKKLHSHVKKQIKLYNALKKYKPEKVKFKIISICKNQKQMNKKEEFYMKLFNCIENGYNIKEAGANGRHSEETKEKCRVAKLGIPRGPMSEEQKKKLSIANKGENSWCFGRPRSEETKRKLSIAHTGKKLSEETIKKLIIINTGRKHSEETKEKISKGNTGKVLSKEHKKKLSLWRTGIKIGPMNEKQKQKISKSAKLYLKTVKWKYLWILTNPNGKVYYVKNLNNFCKNHKLKRGNFYSVLLGHAKTNAGWAVIRKLLTKSNNLLASDLDLFPN